MSSFVRQLNKYSFYKVASSLNDGSLSSGSTMSEFKHPHFRLGGEGELYKICRKAPAPKHPRAMDSFTQSQGISIISENLTATQDQIRNIERTHANEARTNKLLVEEVLALQKMLKAQTEAQHEILNYLSPFTYDGRHNNPRRGTRRKLQP
ncbi:kinase-regulated stress-responsive transcription factor skn7 [Purpureocillium takamizusanense]|nr:kinase-regulated stress-responsive transcription factor skn7 [Purpureocillium takamizusanense]UNI14813.1 kinase-regulated stress-responsive transcription factor skn7 [Purpureocillium takamizusanense]